MLTARDKERLKGVHAALVAVVIEADRMGAEFMVIEGLRTRARQEQLVKAGASKTMNSRHLTGHAVDLGALVAGKVVWHWESYKLLADTVKKAAAKLKTPIVWGGDWKTFRDGPHFELDRRVYP